MLSAVSSIPAARLAAQAKRRSVSRTKASRRCVAAKEGDNGWPTVYRSETFKLVNGLITRQAVKTALVFFGETNGQMHLYLHSYLAENPIQVDAQGAAEEWLVKLACKPITTVTDPRRSSIVTTASVAAATNSEREVSPRDIVERIMAIRVEIARELGVDIDCDQVRVQNQEILRKALTCMVTAKPNLPTL